MHSIPEAGAADDALTELEVQGGEWSDGQTAAIYYEPTSYSFFNIQLKCGEDAYKLHEFNFDGVENIEVMMEGDVDVLDITVDDGEMTVKTSFTDFGKAQDAIEKLIPNIEFDTCETTMLPNEYVELSDPEDIEGFHKLMDMLNEVEDVNKVYTNAILPEE